MRLFRNAFFAAAIAVLVVSCSQKAVNGTAVLTGDVQGDCDYFQIVSFPQDKYMDFKKTKLTDGHFELAIEDVNGFIDLVVGVGDDVFGARVNACDTLRMTFRQLEGKHFDVAYEGATEEESRIWADWYDAYGNTSKYDIRPDRDPAVTFGQSLALLAENDSLFRAKNAGRLSKYHIRRANLGYGFLKAVLMELEAYENDANPFDNPEYVALVKDINPEDPWVVSSGLLPRWADYVKRSLGDDDISRDMAFMEKYGKKIKSADARRMLAGNMAFRITARPELFDDATSAEYVAALGSFVPEWPEVVENCKTAYAAFKRTGRGTDMPDVELTAPDGTTVQLSSLFGKVIYIDVWATWCGPCVGEIPHMAALAERLKDCDDIVCISVSVDDTQEPWQRKLAAEKPAWPQYWLAPEAGDAFSKALNINAIPRFIIVDRHGKIYDANSIRPSNEDIDSVLSSVCRL